jgi:hypothetical protein
VVETEGQSVTGSGFQNPDAREWNEDPILPSTCVVIEFQEFPRQSKARTLHECMIDKCGKRLHN